MSYTSNLLKGHRTEMVDISSDIFDEFLFFGPTHKFVFSSILTGH